MAAVQPVQSEPKYYYKNLLNKKNAEENTKSKTKRFVDSTINQAMESTPMILSLTGILSLFDYANGKMPLKQALITNMAKFFAPVLVGTSLTLAFVETTNFKKKSDKKMETQIV